MLWARFTLGRNWSADVVLKQDHELIVRGPYRYVRHPIYSGGLLMMMGWAVWSGHFVSWISLVVVLVILWLKASAEEKLMTEHFGSAYREYKKRVKALIPYVV
jgi:protein-S-isoprenylcysteine O-methyltransferase Ste14